MDEINNKKPQTTTQAWRKRPRKWAPKSRLGCKTCKIRRVKCDLSRPSCLKCRSTGRTCDGNYEAPLTENCRSSLPCSTLSAHQPPKQWNAKHHGHTLRNLRPFMALPATVSVQREAIYFFEYTSIRHLNEYHPCDSWRKTLMFFCQTVPSVRHAATALALIHRNYLQDRPQSWQDGLYDNAPLLHYNQAIQLLLNQEATNKTETTAVTLLVCYLFTCYDYLAGNYTQALEHLRGGVELSRSVEKTTPGNGNNTYSDANLSGVQSLICQVTNQIRRLDTQAATFLIDWNPAYIHIQQTLTPRLPCAFRSFDEAADHLHILAAQVMGMIHTEQQMLLTGEVPPSHWPTKDVVLRQLETWSSLFKQLQLGSSHDTDYETYPLMSLLHLQHTLIWTLLSSHGPGREMEYDNFLPQFRQCVALADNVAAAHERYSGSSKLTFTPDIGVVPVLYMIGVKCRHPGVRRQALSILRRQAIREAVWDSISTATVVQRVIEIEEGGFGKGGRAQSMEQIPVWQRVEVLSWIHVLNREFATQVDITYTLCTQEGTHYESLAISYP